MHLSFRFGLIVIVLGFALGATAADEDAPSQAAPAAEKSADASEPGPNRQQFDKIFAEWKSLLADLRRLRAEYQTADEARSAEIKKEYDQLIEKGGSMQPELLEAAEKAYVEAPGEDKQLADLLAQTCDNAVNQDDYENAYRLAKILLEGKHDETQLNNWLGIAAFATNRLDEAEKYLKAAQADGALDGLGPQFLQTMPEHRKKWQREQKLRQAEAEADDLPRVLLKTNKGDMVIELFENEAPNTVANFISLVEKGFYDGLTFHRVLAQFMAQGGCPKGDGTAGPGYTIPCECYEPDHREHFRGTLSMAHAGRDTGGSQFFLTFVPTAHLDGRHTVFGRVVDGLDVLAKIQRRDPSRGVPLDPDKILKAEVIRKRAHPYEPKKTGE